mmetsp:Transcript_8104/g.12059  ORF Transcript_8104/g.12059 Transcript_8104/m.12059 type:complete len:525 (-) Transcript_8104:36-1610(-)
MIMSAKIKNAGTLYHLCQRSGVHVQRRGSAVAMYAVRCNASASGARLHVAALSPNNNNNKISSSKEHGYTTTTQTAAARGHNSSMICMYTGHKNKNKNKPSRRLFSSEITRTKDQEVNLATTTSSDGVVAKPIDFDVASRVEGQESQIVTVDLEPGQVLRAESGAMLYMTEGIEMETTTGGGLSAGFKRMLTGQNIMISDFRYTGTTRGTVALGTDFPSKIMRLNVEEYGGKIVCQKGALLCASHTIDIEMEFAKKMTAGFFGGEGFVLQALTGSGDVFVKAGGTLIRRDLQEGETLRISSGCLVAFSDGVEFDVQTMPGFKNVLFGGEGLFITTLTGPGTVWLQGQPPQRMISEIARRVPSGGGIGLGLPIGMGGGGGASGEGSEAGIGEGGDVEGLAAAEEAIENDRAFATASSVMGSQGDDADTDSPSALFGDAAAEEQSPGDVGAASSTSDYFGQEETTSFSSEGVDNDEFSTDEFAQDDTTFSTHDEDSASSFEGSDGAEDNSEGGLMSTLWSLFSDND